MVKVVGAALYDTTGEETSVFKPLRLFSEQGIAQFNDLIAG